MTDRIMPAWVQTLGAILRNEGIEITSRCSKCGRMRKVDVAALAAKVGADFSLINRRSRCRIDGCRGSWRFWYSTGTWTWRMWDDAAEARWLSHEVAEMQSISAAEKSGSIPSMATLPDPALMTDEAILREWECIDCDTEDKARTDALAASSKGGR